MIKRVKELRPDVKIASPDFRKFVEKFESEINRGISNLCVLSIINQYDEEGIYGYKILKVLEEETNNILIIEEGTLYPLLRNLESEGLIDSKKQKTGRKRKYYYMTDEGKKIFNYLSGYYSKLTKAIANLIEINVEFFDEKYIYCPMCANKIDLEKEEHRYCTICGYNIEQDLEKRRK